jgi:hypothetical protein
MAEINTTSITSPDELHDLACKVGCALNDIEDLVEVLQQLYGAEIELKVGALSTAALRLLNDAQEACTEIEMKTCQAMEVEHA